MNNTTGTLSQERCDLLDMLRTHRELFKGTTVAMTDEQAATRSTVSQLTLGGLVKHVTLVERQWSRFAIEGADAFAGEPWVGLDWDGLAALTVVTDWESGFAMLPGDTLASLIAEYDAVAGRTDELVATLPDLDRSYPLPPAPWNEPGAAWSVRRVFMHIVAETAQHAGHADIIRETIDGAKSMG